jgi:Pyrimidine dimer DNA glycosylase
MLCDKHVVKMPLETAQMLSTVWHECSEPASVPPEAYRPSHKHHPCVVWARTTTSNYYWLHDHGIALCDEYTYRYGKRHASRAVIEALGHPPAARDCLPVGPLQPFAQAMPEGCRNPADPVLAYRKYYSEHKREMATWKRRDPPLWFVLRVHALP